MPYYAASLVLLLLAASLLLQCFTCHEWRRVESSMTVSFLVRSIGIALAAIRCLGSLQ